MCKFIIFCSIVREKGLVIMPTAPSAALFSSMEAFFVPVRNMTGISAQPPVFNFSKASKPFISGISISSSITDGLIFSKSVNIFDAEGIVITLKSSSNASSAFARLVSLSSTTKIVFNFTYFPYTL